MKKKWVITLMIAVGASLLASYHLSEMVKDRKHDKAIEDAYEFFEAERDEVYRLSEAIKQVIETPNAENYRNAYEAAVKTEAVCRQTKGKIENSVKIGGDAAASTYYSTFYRDIKAGLNDQCGTEDLQLIHQLLEKIISYYDGNSVPRTVKEKTNVMLKFHQSLLLIDEELKLCLTIFTD